MTLARTLGHAMWRDELQAWMIASDSTSLAGMFQNMRCEGHPGLWYLCLFLLSRVTASPVAMQVFHVGVATSTVYAIARHAPVRPLLRGLICAGYFLSFEYAVISRSYALGAALLAFLCVELTGKRRPIVVGVLAFLAMQTSFHAALVVGVLGIAMLDTTLLGGPRDSRWVRVPAAALALGAIAFVVQVIPAETCTPVLRPPGALFSAREILRAGALVWGGYAPIPSGQRFWGTQLLWQHDGLATIFGAALLAAFACSFRRAKSVLAAYLLGSFGLLAFSYARYFGGIRHHGHLFLLLGACAWLATAREDATRTDSAETDPARRLRFATFSLVTLLQLAAGVVALVVERTIPFSTSAQVAKSLRENGLANATVIAAGDVETSPVAGYLGHPLYYANSRSEGRFVVRDRSRSHGQDVGALAVLAEQETARSGKTTVIVTSFRFPGERYGLKRLAELDPCLVRDECFSIWLREP